MVYSDMSQLNQLKQAAGNSLKQGILLLESINLELYQANSGTYGVDDTIGRHWRHILNHFHAFFLGYCSGKIDYFNRTRSESIEKGIGAGIKGGKDSLLYLCKMNLLELQLQVRGDYGITESSTGRELEFLISHTTHHYAVMRIILQKKGIDFSDDFGYSRSTILEKKCVP